jgi:hypothetical protein
VEINCKIYIREKIERLDLAGVDYPRKVFDLLEWKIRFL